MKIIPISGKMRHGKDTSAAFIKRELENQGRRVLIIHYGDYLKFLLKNYYGWSGDKTDKGSRELLQHFGTDVIRKQEPYFWVDNVIHFLKLTQADWDFVLIPDTRFPNEIARQIDTFGRENVITIRVDRLDFVPEGATQEQLQHESETALDRYPFDYYLYNTKDLDGLQEKVHIFCNEVL